jgi:hypothetical protein
MRWAVNAADPFFTSIPFSMPAQDQSKPHGAQE